MSPDAAAPRPRRVSIRAKLLAATGILLVLSTLVYGWVAFDAARTALLPSIREQLADDTINVKGGLEEMLTAHYRNVHTWARLAMMRELVVRDMDKTIARFLESVHHDYGVYLEVLVLDREGLCIASSDAAHIGRDFAGTPIAGAGVETGRLWQPTLQESADRRQAYLRLAAAVPDPDRRGRTLGTLVAMLDRSVLNRIVVSKPGHSHVELRLLDNLDRPIAGRDTPLEIAQMGVWQVEEPGDGAGLDKFPSGAPPILREGRDSSGRAYILSEVPIGSPDTLPTPGWRLVASVPKDLALAPVAAVRDRVLATGLALIVLALVVAAWLASRIARPIRDLTEAASRMARRGDLEAVPSPTSHDEVGELTTAFQSMVRAVAAANEEMVRSSKLAFLGEMAAGMAHEVRTPLGIIRNSAQLLERRMDSVGDREAAEWAVFIREESDRLARVVTELLEFVKPSPPMKQDVDLSSLAQRSAAMLGAEADKRGVRIAVEAPGPPVVAPCDADQIHQVLLNLLMNALQASGRESEVRVTVESRGDKAAIIVRDRGSGIPPGFSDRIFEPFTSERDGGIGLGLAIVRRIVLAHGGDVEARDRTGGGAKFVVFLPLFSSTGSGESHAT